MCWLLMRCRKWHKPTFSTGSRAGTEERTGILHTNPLKDWMITICEEEGLTQAQFIETLLERELSERGVLDVKTSHS
ncbi:RepB family protein [Yersinia pestis]